MKHCSPDNPPSPSPDDLFLVAHVPHTSYLDEAGVNIDSDTAPRLIVSGHRERHVTDVTADIEHVQSAEPLPAQPAQTRVQLTSRVRGLMSEVTHSRLSQPRRESS